MNLLARKKLGWLLWLTPFLFSCESDEILSLPQEPGDQTLNLYFTEIPLDYSLVQLDSVLTSRRPSDESFHLLSGTYQNEFFGEVQTTAFTELTIDTRAEVTTEDEYDSLVMTLVNNYFHGDASQVSNEQIGIFRLTDTLKRTAYYRTDEVPYEATPLAELDFMPDPEVDNAGDTLRVTMDASFGQDLFDLAKSDARALQSDSAFREYFSGIALVSLTGNNFITGFDPSRMRMTLYYSASSETESSTYTFDVGAGQAATFNNISVDRSGTPLSNVIDEDEKLSAADGGFYLQAGTGLVPTLSLQPILDFIEDLEDSTSARSRVNRVELYLGTTPLGKGRALPREIVAFSFEDDFSVKVDTTQDGFGRLTTVPRGLQIDNVQPRNNIFPISPSESTYQILITQYFQNLVNEVPGGETEFMIRPIRLGNRMGEIVAEPDSVFAKVYYTLLE